MTEPAPARQPESGTVRFTFRGTEVFRPGVGPFPAYTVSEARIENGIMVAVLRGTDDHPDGGISRTRLTAGQSVTDARAGTFTLLHVTPQAGGLTPGLRAASATFEFQPAPGFELAAGLVSGRGSGAGSGVNGG